MKKKKLTEPVPDAGKIMVASDGRRYEIQNDGSWRRIKPVTMNRKENQ